jgi:hypothetical protein
LLSNPPSRSMFFNSAQPSVGDGKTPEAHPLRQ